MAQSIAWTIPLFPLLGFLVAYLLRFKLSSKVAGSIASAMVLIPFVISVALFFSVDGKVTIHLFDWIKAGSISIPFDFFIDPLSITMMMIVTGVGSLIHLYSIGYMGHDENANTFFSYLNLFIFFMLMLVMGANYVILFIGWEGVGLCSYLLIGFWHKNTEYNNAARKAFVMNRIGDLGFLLGIILLLFTFGTVSFTEVFAGAGALGSGSTTITLITILLLIGAMGKSAQIPLFTWLPDAMAGPTPVSALIHAATMVTAGIYLIARSSILYALAPITMDLVMIVGLATAVIAATIGIFQNDIKKVLAYSTVSQLGYMFFALGLGAFSAAMFHVTTHAFFKALLFLGAGSVIHALGGEQDIRKMGGLRKGIPTTFITFLIGTMAISGIPPLAGFFSKDAILAAAFEHNPLLWGLGVATAFVTCFYMFRLLFLTFFGEFRGTSEQKHHLHESPKVMTIPLMILALLSIVGGFLDIPAIFGGSQGFTGYLKPSLGGQNFETSTVEHTTELLTMFLPVLLLVAIILIAYKIYVGKKDIPADDTVQRRGLANIMYHKYYFDEIYNYIFVKPYSWLSETALLWFDNTIIDGVVNGVGTVMMRCGALVRKVQNGSVSLYLYLMVAGIIAIFLFLLVG